MYCILLEFFRLPWCYQALLSSKQKKWSLQRGGLNQISNKPAENLTYASLMFWNPVFSQVVHSLVIAVTTIPYDCNQKGPITLVVPLPGSIVYFISVGVKDYRKHGKNIIWISAKESKLLWQSSAKLAGSRTQRHLSQQEKYCDKAN